MESNLREILEKVAKRENVSLTKLINSRLESSLTLEDRLGPPPPHLSRELLGGDEKIEFELPEPLATYQRMIEAADRLKIEAQKLYDDEVDIIIASDR